MCRGYQQNESDRLLNIKAFYLRLSLSSSSNPQNTLPFPDSLTLHFLPRINGSPLEVNSSKIRSDSPAFITLHRVVSPSIGSWVCFMTRERVKAGEGARFEVYLGDQKLLKGFFRKDWDDDDEWKMECSCALECGGVGRLLQDVVKEVEVCVAAGGDVAMRERVEMLVKKKRRSGGGCFQGTLEEIPEETEREYLDGGCCCCNSDIGTDEEEEQGMELESSHESRENDGGGNEDLEVADMSWAVDVGIWVMCLGVGLLVSKASSKRLLKRTGLL